METQHTPGPWVIRKSEIEIIILGPHTDKIFIAEVKSETNARLIAAAPELLEALEEMLIGIPNTYREGINVGEHTTFNGHPWKTIDKAKRAIQKATQAN